MSILSSIIFNIRERVTSGDLNNLQAWAAKNSQQALRTIATGGAGNEATFLPGVFLEHRALFGGLAPSPGAAPDTLDIGSGSLLNYQPSFPPPLAGEPFSPWRFYDSLDATPTQPPTVPIPAIGPKWYLLEARVSESIASQVRDIRQLFTNLFAPQLVPKIRTTTLEYQWIAGADSGPFPSPTGVNGWRPLCFVFRTNVGGVVLASQVYDVRLLPSDVANWPSQRAQNREGSHDIATAAAPSNEVSIITREPALALGVPLEVGRDAVGALTRLDLSTVLDVNDVAFAPSTTYYLYLCGYRGLPMRRLDQPYERGRIICSTQPPTRVPFGVGTSPTELCWVNGAALLDPGPGQGAGPLTGEAILVGAVIRNVANTGWVKMIQTGRSARCEGQTGGAGNKNWNQGGSTIGVFLAPAMARSLACGLSWTAIGGQPTQVALVFPYFGGIGSFMHAQAAPAVGGLAEFQIESAVDGVDPAFAPPLVTNALGAVPVTWDVNVFPKGWRW